MLRYLHYHRIPYVAVSYTHLDVYKRQVLYKDLGGVLPDHDHLQGQLLGLRAPEGSRRRPATEAAPVSYTHLDVYKRQAQYTAKVTKDLGGDIKIVKFTRFQKGEGLEKRADDFAAEVASMVK